MIKAMAMNQLHAYEPLDELVMITMPDFSALTTNQYNAMLFGIVHGLVTEEGLTNTEQCFTDAKTTIARVKKSLGDLKARKWETTFEDFGFIATSVPEAVRDCKLVKDDIPTIMSWATVFTAPMQLPNVIKTNITQHLIGITRHVNQAKNDWKSEEFYAFGTILGELLVIVTQPLAQTDAAELEF